MGIFLQCRNCKESEFVDLNPWENNAAVPVKENLSDEEMDAVGDLIRKKLKTKITN